MSWERVRGHDAARLTFHTAFTRGRFGQAYLLVGPDGIGKRCFAIELAKALLCEHTPTPLTACDHCPACVQVEAATHPDVFRLRTPDGKHELPVELMREFCTQMALKPARGSRKIGIIEDADDFNEESANSFLKTLEEPPPGSVLLLIATSTERQLPTILSRCQVVRFSPLRHDDLRAVLTANGITDDAQLTRLIRLANGSVGRALALTDPAIDEVRRKLIIGLTDRRPDFRALAETWSHFYEEAGKETALQRQRVSLVLGLLVDALRAALHSSLGVQSVEQDTDESRRLREFGMRLGPDGILELIEACLTAEQYVERRVQLILVIERVLEQFTRPAHAALGPR